MVETHSPWLNESFFLFQGAGRWPFGYCIHDSVFLTLLHPLTPKRTVAMARVGHTEKKFISCLSYTISKIPLHFICIPELLMTVTQCAL